jgi:alpha-1,6-mannosyltransferase
MSVHGPLGATPPSGAFELRTPALNARGLSSRARLGLLGLSGLLLTGLVISVSAANTDNLLPESVRPVPSWLAGPFGSTGINLHVGGVVAVFVLMFASYALVVRSADRLSPRLVLTTIAALHALVLLAPPLLSTDVFSYQAYARMWSMYGANPYLHGPHVIALDPLYPFIGAKWVTTPTAYGPVFTTLSYLLGPLSIAASALSYKVIAALSSLALIGVVWHAARLRGLDPVKAVALVGLNPLIVVYGVGGGHNDLLMLAVSTAGVYAVLRHRERAGGSLLTLGVGIKLTAGLLLPFAAASSGGLGSRDRRRDLLIGAGVSAAMIVVLAFLAFGTGPLHLFNTLRQTQNEGDWKSIPGFISTRLGLGEIGHITGLLLGVLFLGVTGWLVRRVWRNEMDWVDGAAWATVALLCTASSLLPWYVAWLIPLVALGADRRLWRVAFVMTAVVQGIQLLGYIPHGSSLLGI